MAVKTTGESAAEDDKKKRTQLIINIILLALSVLIIGAVSVAVETGLFGTMDDSKSSYRTIQSICSATDFPGSCYTKFHKAVGERGLPIRFVKAGIDLALQEILPAMNTENKDFDQLQTYQIDTVANCVQLLDSAAEGLRDMAKLIESDNKILDSNPEELRSGLSAVISSARLCIEELELDNCTYILDPGPKHLPGVLWEESSYLEEIMGDYPFGCRIERISPLKGAKSVRFREPFLIHGRFQELGCKIWLRLLMHGHFVVKFST